jgi:hypothetical protein
MAELTGNPGFAAPRTEKALSRRAIAIELIATVSLTVSLVIAATAVSLGTRSRGRSEFVERPSALMPMGVLLDQAQDWLPSAQR